ncbi:MAG: glycosyl hydrolase family 18 protein, partial [Tannerellaceae bacterium]
GMPFYGRGNDAVGNFIDYKDIINLQGYQEAWSDESQAPYLADTAGVMVCSFDNPRSIRLKCDFIKANNLKGAMYWQYDGDDAQGTLRNTIVKELR